MALGKNLGNLLGEYFGEQEINLNSTNTQVIEVALKDVEHNPHQTRKNFDQSKIIALAKNIEKNGLINPITLLQKPSGKYILLAGERRLRAFEYLEKKTIPAIVQDYKKLTENDKFLISASENLQREALNPLETAKTFRILMDTHDWSLRSMADSVGSSPQHILNYLNLLKLHPIVQEALIIGDIGEAHARRLLPLDSEKQVHFLKLILKNKLSIRALSDLVAQELNLNQAPQFSKNSWVNKLPPKQFEPLETWANALPKSVVKAKGDEKKGKIIITWGGFSD